jgi:hypothetical protein
MTKELAIMWCAWVALVFTPPCHGEDKRVAAARRQIGRESPVLLQMVDQASIVAHVVVTNLEFAKYGSVTGNRACTLACSVVEMVKGPTNETSLLVTTWLKWAEHQRFTAGTNYIVFITSQNGEKELFRDRDHLTDHWLGIQPYDQQLMAELRTLLGKEQTSRRRTDQTKQPDNSAEDVRVKIE